MKTLKTLGIVILVILVLPLFGYGIWQLKKAKTMEIFVVNKSMTQFRGSENKAFNYLLNTEKIYAIGNRTYDLKIDHFGLIWNNGDYNIRYPRLKDLGRTAEKYDMIYFADANGIRTSDTRKLKEGEEDKVLYGGANNIDYILLKDLLKLEKPLVLECNFFGPPTEPLVRYNIENLIDIYYVGWIGKYMDDLSAEPDMQAGVDWKELYKNYTGNEWNASGKGIVMINPSAKRVFFLEEGVDIETEEGLILTSDEGVDAYNLPEMVNYSGWFTLVHEGQNKVLSSFKLNATDEGSAKINSFGVPESFPALIHADKNSYFMAGDFGKCQANEFFPKVSIIGPIYNGMKRRSKSSSNFFYSYYQPFMTAIVDESLRIKNSEEN